LVGYTAGTVVALDLPALLQADVRLLPVNLIRRAPEAAAAAPARLSDLSGRLSLRIERYTLRNAPAALQRLASGQAAGRVALLMWHRRTRVTHRPDRRVHRRPPARR
jgi:NADPH2:quinone reductase